MPDMTAVADPSFSQHARLYEIYRSYIVHENDLINNRVGWFIQLHSFLIATYGIVVTSIIGSFFVDHEPRIQSFYPQLIGCLLLLMIEVVGAFSSHAARQSIDAANTAIMELQRRWETYCTGHPHMPLLFPGLTGGGSKDSTAAGLRLHRSLPHALFMLWKVSTTVPVLFAVLSLANCGVVPLGTTTFLAMLGLLCVLAGDLVRVRRAEKRRVARAAKKIVDPLPLA